MGGSKLFRPLQLLTAILLGLGYWVDAKAAIEVDTIGIATNICRQLQKSPFYQAPIVDGVESSWSAIRVRQRDVGQRHVYHLENNQSIRIDIFQQASGPGRIIGEIRNQHDQPVFFIGLNPNCQVAQSRRLVYENFIASTLEILDQSLKPIQTELLNPAPIDNNFESRNNRLLVAMIDSGVNYLLPQIGSRIPRDAMGNVFGYDFWDRDPRPFDSHPAASPFFVQRHGTRTASLLLIENPNIGLVSYRYPRPEMARFKALVAHANGLGIRIVGMPLGSNRLQDWIEFEKAARAHQDMLFVVSAGNNGRNIDKEPVFPASMEITNMIVVTSADDLGRPAERTNWGPISVDFLLPAERYSVRYFNGELGLASGSSYAVSRLVAMAAGILVKNPTVSTTQLIDLISAHTIESTAGKFVRLGFIPDPKSVQQTVSFTPIDFTRNVETASAVQDQVEVDILVLDRRWSLPKLEKALDQVDSILSQCELTINISNYFQLQGSEYLRYLHTGSSHTLLDSFSRQTNSTAIRLILAADTKMEIQYEAEAFGEGNSRTRPWLRDSVWVMHGAPDLGITIAHELFHVLANNGDHPKAYGNLMSAETSGDNIRLTSDQCDMAKRYLSS